jgi:transcriptional regulator with XRE-family HTH domain
MNFAQALTTLMDEQGISGCELARRAGCDRSYIYRLKQGKQPPSAKIAKRCDEVLGAGGELMALTGEPTQPSRRAVLAGGLLAGGMAGAAAIALDATERERIAWAQRHPRTIDGAAVASLTASLAAQRHLEDSIGSAAMLKPARGQLAAVEQLLTEARGPARPAVLGVASDWAQFCAWLHTSRHDFPAARALCRKTLEMAVEAGNPSMTSMALRMQGYIAYLEGQPGPMIGLSAAAQRDPRACATVRAIAASNEGRGHAMVGDAKAAERKLGLARDLAGRAQATHWPYWATPKFFDCEAGVALGYLAHIPRYHTQAIDLLTAGYKNLDPDLARAEWGGGAYLVHRAGIHARGGDVAEACADALRVVPIWRQANSVSLRGMLVQLHNGLAAKYPGEPRVKQLADALA